MRLSKAGYYADFFVYPPAVMTLAAAASRSPVSFRWVGWLVACGCGLAVWSLVEYLFHRFILHRLPYVAKMHDMHHRDPRGFVGTPTWLSLPAIVAGAFVPLWWEINLPVASGFTAGVMLGYVGYVGVHHVVHHWRIDRSSCLYKLKLRHAQHHYASVEGNFGVTMAFWDYLFRTEIERRPRATTQT